MTQITWDNTSDICRKKCSYCQAPWPKISPDISQARSKTCSSQRRARLEAERDDRLFIEFDRVLQTKAAENPDVGHMLHGQVQLFETHLAYRRQTEKERRNQIEQITLQIEGLSAQAQAAKRQLALLGEELETQLSLRAKGLADRAQIASD